MTTQLASYNQTISFSNSYLVTDGMSGQAGYWDYDMQFGCSRFTHRENIIEALFELATRNEETAAFTFGTFGRHIEVTTPFHYDQGCKNNASSNPHFNIKRGTTTYHIYTTKNMRKIVRVTEILEHHFSF